MAGEAAAETPSAGWSSPGTPQGPRPGRTHGRWRTPSGDPRLCRWSRTSRCSTPSLREGRRGLGVADLKWGTAIAADAERDGRRVHRSGKSRGRAHDLQDGARTSTEGGPWRKVEILAVDQKVDAPARTVDAATRSVTLSVTPEQATKLTLARRDDPPLPEGTTDQTHPPSRRGTMLRGAGRAARSLVERNRATATKQPTPTTRAPAVAGSPPRRSARSGGIMRGTRTRSRRGGAHPTR